MGPRKIHCMMSIELSFEMKMSRCTTVPDAYVQVQKDPVLGRKRFASKCISNSPSGNVSMRRGYSVISYHEYFRRHWLCITFMPHSYCPQ